MLSLLLLSPLLRVSAADSSYRETLTAVHDRFARLEMEANDYRKAQPILSPDQEQEFLRLHGQLLRDDPVWALLRQLYDDIKAVDAIPEKTSADKALLETLKNLLATVSSHAETATTRKQAEEYALALRQFVARRDFEGAKAWSQAREAKSP
jgi:hypothetical protein